MKLSKSLSDACSLLDAEGTDITRADLLRWYAHARELEDNLELMRMSEAHLAKYSSGHFKRAEAAEAKLKKVRAMCEAEMSGPGAGYGPIAADILAILDSEGDAV